MDENTPQERAKARGYWMVPDLADASGLTGARIRQLLLDGSDLRGRKVGAERSGFWTVDLAEGKRWLDELAAR